MPSNKPTNKEIIDIVVKEMPKEHAERISNIQSTELLGIMEQYPSTLNSFINTLTNKVTKTIIYSKIYNNPLKAFKKKLEYGDTIEELFVQMAQVKGFTANWDNTAKTPEADLIRKLVPKVSAMYIQVNVDYKSKATVMDKQLRKAFLNEEGLSNMITQIVGSITSAMEFKEFNLTKAALNYLVSSGEQITSVSETGEITKGAIPSGMIKQTPYIVQSADIIELSENIRETVGDMSFPSSKFNLAKEITWSKPEELTLITTSATIAKLDVQVLANAFNISKAELVTRTILVDELPSGIFKGTDALVDKIPSSITAGDTLVSDDTKKPLAVLIDNDLLQLWDTHQGAGTFHNPEGEYTNHFANREGIFATCLFANMAVFY